MSAPPPLRPLPPKALSMIVGRIRQVLKWLPDLLGAGGGGGGGKQGCFGGRACTVKIVFENSEFS